MRQAWTPERNATFAGMWNAGKSDAEIGAACQLGETSVRMRARQLGLESRRGRKAAAKPAAPTGPEAASIDAVVSFLRSRDIMVVRDQEQLDPPRWNVDGKGQLGKDEMLDYANRLRREMGKPEFFYGL